ncbi:hypothetical protein CSIM01_06214 [Colletotrichum simmondsii]|uniref:Uncharacterized protein n=1 Tax=Colletotrichum simmondsii TaxID=703756 RepID=A0A135SNI7_9PEZI|nr:hypothetical protein CSIM01_06214 [Colletotrichum simmondsii]
MKATETATTDKPQSRAAQIPTVVATAMCKRALHRVTRDVPSGYRRFGNIICKEVANFSRTGLQPVSHRRTCSLCAKYPYEYRILWRLENALESGDWSSIRKPRNRSHESGNFRIPHSLWAKFGGIDGCQLPRRGGPQAHKRTKWNCRPGDFGVRLLSTDTACDLLPLHSRIP